MSIWLQRCSYIFGWSRVRDPRWVLVPARVKFLLLVPGAPKVRSDGVREGEDVEHALVKCEEQATDWLGGPARRAAVRRAIRRFLSQRPAGAVEWTHGPVRRCWPRLRRGALRGAPLCGDGAGALSGRRFGLGRSIERTRPRSRRPPVAARTATLSSRSPSRLGRRRPWAARAHPSCAGPPEGVGRRS